MKMNIIQDHLLMNQLNKLIMKRANIHIMMLKLMCQINKKTTNLRNSMIKSKRLKLIQFVLCNGMMKREYQTIECKLKIIFLNIEYRRSRFNLKTHSN